MIPAKESIEYEQLINIYARWFGNLLTGLKSHDLHYDRQTEVPSPYTPASKVEFLGYIR